jgi:hypothetical protein
MKEPVLVPIYGFVRGDTLGLLVLVHENDSVATLAAALTEAASVRVAPAARARVFSAGRELDPKASVRSAGLLALDRVDLVPENA